MRGREPPSAGGCCSTPTGREALVEAGGAHNAPVPPGFSRVAGKATPQWSTGCEEACSNFCGRKKGLEDVGGVVDPLYVGEGKGDYHKVSHKIIDGEADIQDLCSHNWRIASLCTWQLFKMGVLGLVVGILVGAPFVFFALRDDDLLSPAPAPPAAPVGALDPTTRRPATEAEPQPPRLREAAYNEAPQGWAAATPSPAWAPQAASAAMPLAPSTAAAAPGPDLAAPRSLRAMGPVVWRTPEQLQHPVASRWLPLVQGSWEHVVRAGSQ